MSLDPNNQARMHLSLNKDAPLSRPIQTIGRIPFHDQSWADCIIIMSGFSFRQGQHPNKRTRAVLEVAQASG